MLCFQFSVKRLTPDGHLKVTHTYTNMQLKAVGFFKYAFQKVRHSRRGGGGSKKKKKDREKVISFTQSFSVPIFSANFLLLSISWGSDNLVTRKQVQDAICVSILADVKLRNSTILPTWLVNICASLRKSVCAHGLTLQFLTLSTSFNYSI